MTVCDWIVARMRCVEGGAEGRCGWRVMTSGMTMSDDWSKRKKRIGGWW